MGQLRDAERSAVGCRWDGHFYAVLTHDYKLYCLSCIKRNNLSPKYLLKALENQKESINVTSTFLVIKATESRFFIGWINGWMGG